MEVLADDRSVIQRILDHIDNDTTDVSETVWREPVEHYRSPERFAAELALVLRRFPTPFCPSAALPELEKRLVGALGRLTEIRSEHLGPKPRPAAWLHGMEDPGPQTVPVDTRDRPSQVGDKAQS